MTDRAARMEGFARAQLTQGKGMGSIVHDLVRLARIDKDESRTIVERAWPAVHTQYVRRRRKTFWLGAMILAIPGSMVASFLLANLLFPDGMGRGAPTLEDVLIALLIPPISFPSIVGLALMAYGGSAMKRGKAGSAPGLPGSMESAPVRTGLGWRAEPFGNFLK